MIDAEKLELLQQSLDDLEGKLKRVAQMLCYYVATSEANRLDATRAEVLRKGREQ
jgi:hypothetical protein